MRRIAVSSAAVLLAALAGCGSSGASGDTTLTVFAAASLQPTFEQLGKTFEQQHPDVTVRFSYGGSSDLMAQIQQGAPADVFASADETNMDKAADQLAGDRVDIASNTLEIAVPPDNPASVFTFADLTKPDTKVVVCAPEVPCGAAARKVEDATGDDIAPVSEESSVTDVLNKVVSGEADAGLVYVTDVKAAGDKVRGVPFQESSEAVNVYPIASLAGSSNAELAGAFVDLVSGSEGQRVLRAAGFAKP